MKRVALFLLFVLAGIPARAFDPFVEAGIDQRPDARLPLDLQFRDQGGNLVTLGEIADGKPLVLAPVLHRCPNICGITLAGLAEAVRAQSFVPGRDFSVVAFGIDPREGNAEATASIEDLAKVSPALAGKIHALTGEAADIAAVTSALGYRYAWDPRIGQYAHVAAVAVLTADGHLSRWLYGLEPDPVDLKLALTEAGQGRLGTWGEQLLLLCYHYDPSTGRYDSVITWLLRLGGGFTVLSGAAWIAISILRERQLSERRGA
jgi:protein SCO1/2